jgi:hypothetical protein
MDPARELEAELLNKKPFDSSDEKEVNNRNKAMAALERERLETLRALMDHSNGRKVVFDMVKCALDGRPYVIGDTHATAYNLGLEAKARQINRDVILAAPKQYLQMLDECKDAI